VEQVLDGVDAPIRAAIQTPAPVAAEGPVGAADPGEIEPGYEAEVGIAATRRTMNQRAHVIDANPSARAVDRGHGRPGNFGAHFFIESVTFREGNDGRIFAGRTERAFLHQRLLIVDR